MTEDTIYTLVASSNRGRYALDTPDGLDLTAGATIAIQLGEQWITGSIEHTGNMYAVEATGHTERGYYFRASGGRGLCGLCAGMKVKLL